MIWMRDRRVRSRFVSICFDSARFTSQHEGRNHTNKRKKIPPNCYCTGLSVFQTVSSRLTSPRDSTEQHYRKKKLLARSKYYCSAAQDTILRTFSTESFHSDGDVGGRKRPGRGRRCLSQNTSL